MKNDLPKPLVVHMSDNGGMFLVAAAVNDKEVHFVNEKLNTETQPKEEFIRSWSGIVLLVDSKAEVEEEHYKTNRIRSIIKSLKYPLAITSPVLIAIYALLYLHGGLNLFTVLFLLTKAVGILACIPLIIRLIDKENFLVRKMCGASNSKTKADCSSILESSAAYFLEIFAWSEVGLLYFLVFFLYVLLFPGTQPLFITAVMAVTATLYTFYSIYYQWQVAKQWCRMCLIVQGVLFVEFLLALTFLIGNGFTEQASFQNMYGLLLLAATATAVYSLLKPMLIQWKSHESQFSKLNKIKLNTGVFEVMLKENAPISTQTISPLQFGNPQGEHVLTIVTNPSCGPCIEMHRKLFNILQNKKNTLVNEILLPDAKGTSSSFEIADLMLKLNRRTGVIQNFAVNQVR